MSGVVLAGGRSRRLGRDKALLPVDGTPLLRRVVDRLHRMEDVADVVVAAGPLERRDAYADLLPGGVRVVADTTPDRGPVAGLAAGLASCAQPLAAVVPVDAPFPSPDVVTGLAERARGRDGAVAVMEGRLQVAHGVFATTAAPSFAAALDEGVDALQAVVRRLDVAVVDEADVRRWDGAERHFLNVNTPEDAARLLGV